MMRFLIQTVEEQVVHDFTFHLVKAIEYQNWYANQPQYEKAFVGDTYTKEEGIPVGSLEFVFRSMREQFGIEKRDIAPINIPIELRESRFLGRNVFIANSCDVKLDREMFVKSNTEYKGFTNLVQPGTTIEEGEYLYSELVDFASEWRAFVHRGELVGLQHYLGDFRRFPNLSALESMIQTYATCPPAYTLDVGVIETGTVVIEVHPFVSCGLYGFQDYRRLPAMFVQGFDFMLRQAQAKQNGR